MKIAAIVLTLILVLVLYYGLTRPLGVRLALPIGSVVSMEELHQSFPNGDYLHCVRAKATEEQFERFLKKMALEKNKGTTANVPACSVPWWDVDLRKVPLYGTPNNTNDSAQFGAYSKGSIYYVSHSL